nr:flocculation protein FLO11-like [Procambarus clarkii]
MRWSGMSGMGVRGPLITPSLARAAACFLVVAAATCAQPAHPSHASSHLHHTTTTLTVSNIKVRPERAALTPPTVTSLRPPDRNKNGQHVGGVTIPGEQSGSNSPPIVASLSPSSIGSSDHHPYRNTPGIIYHRQPISPVATAASNSGNDADLTKQHFLRAHHHTHFAPTPRNISSSTRHKIPMLAATATSWNSSMSAHADTSITRRARKDHRDTRISSRMVPEPVEEGDTKEVTLGEAGGTSEDNAAVGGVWETRAIDEGTVLEKGNHRPHFSDGRPDTFGHSITEDLSHLKTEHSPRRDRGREAVTFISYPASDHSSRAASDQYYPRHHGFAVHEDNFHNTGSTDSHISSGSIPEQVSRRVSVSHHVAGHTHQPHPERTSEPFHGGFESVDYTLQSRNNQEGNNPRVYGLPTDDFHQNDRVVRERGTSPASPNTATTTSSSARPLSIQEIVRAKNMSNTDDLLLFLKEKNIPFRKLIEFINRGAKIQEVLLFLQSDTDTPTNEPSFSSKSNSKPLRDLSLTDEEYAGNVFKNKTRPRKNSEISQVAESPESNSGIIFSEKIHVTATSDLSDNQNFPLSTSPEDELNDEALKDTIDTDDEKKQRRNRNKGQRVRQRGKNRGKKNKGKKGKKGEQGLPDLVYTTVILPVDTNINGSGAKVTQFSISTETPLTTTTIPSVSTKSFITTESNIPNLSTDIPTPASSSTQSPITTLPDGPARKTTFTHLAVSRPSINLAQIPVSPQSPTTALASATATLLPTTVFITSTHQTTPPPTSTTISLDPSGGNSGTPLPETEGFAPAKTSEVSILSVTIMEIPAEKNNEDETVLEYPKPSKKRPSHQQDTHRSHERRRPPKVLHNYPKHTSVSTMEQTENELKSRTNFVREQQTDDYVFPVKGILIISGVLGALAVFTLVVLISYAVIKCSKKPVVNNYQVSEQKPVAQ